MMAAPAPVGGATSAPDPAPQTAAPTTTTTTDALEAIDAPLVRVPLEALKRAAKERKAVVDEVEQALLAAAAAGGGGGPNPLLRAALERARARLAAVSRAEADEARRCRARLAHLLAAGSTPPKPSAAAAAPAPGIDAAAAAAAASAAAAAAAAADAGRGAKAARASLAASAGVGPVPLSEGGGGVNGSQGGCNGGGSGGGGGMAGLDVLAGGFGPEAGGVASGNGNGGDTGTSASPTVAWAKRRLDRLLADYMLRQGYSTSASLLVSTVAAEAGGAGQGADDGAAAAGQPASAAPAPDPPPGPLADLLDWGAFEHAPAVLAALRRRDPAPALAWAAEHRARLRRLRSPLEFRLRLGEFLELVRAGRRAAAVEHARRTIGPLLLAGAAGGSGGTGAVATAAAGQPAAARRPPASGGTAADGSNGAAPSATAAAAAAAGPPAAGADGAPGQPPLERDPLRLLQRAAATLALGPDTRAPRYARLFSDAAWEDLAALFLEELFRLHGLPGQAPLAAHLQAGLTALKHPAAPSAAAALGGAAAAAAAAEEQGAGGGAQPPAAPVARDADGDVAMADGAAAPGGKAPAASAAAAAAAALLLPPPPSRDDPMSVPELRALAEALPASKRGRSRLVCRVTRLAMDDHNPPLVLPNGYVYSSRGVDALVAALRARGGAGAVAAAAEEAGAGRSGGGAGGASGGGRGRTGGGDGDDEALMCPMTGQVFRRSQLRRAYIV